MLTCLGCGDDIEDQVLIDKCAHEFPEMQGRTRLSYFCPECDTENTIDAIVGYNFEIVR